MIVQDGDGFGGLGKKMEDVTEENLRDIKEAPVVLVLVADALRGPVTLINQLQLLTVVSDINERNCFLVLTKAGRLGNPSFDEEQIIQASEYDPEPFLAMLEEYGVNFFEAKRNVACIDMGIFDKDRFKTIDKIRATVCQMRPLIVRETYKELVDISNGNDKALNEHYKNTQAMIEARKKDQLWYERCKKGVVKKEIKMHEENLLNVENQRKDAAERLVKFRSLIQEAKGAKDTMELKGMSAAA
ncbi:hypothetical protein H9P43_008678 [Blastocladiella emersonii ATCC 22665]|nr:hypothetical protein H9P43_008678 [Blastocladiella emersonii ATCC 22665]